MFWARSKADQANKHGNEKAHKFDKLFWFHCSTLFNCNITNSKSSHLVESIARYSLGFMYHWYIVSVCVFVNICIFFVLFVFAFVNIFNVFVSIRTWWYVLKETISWEHWEMLPRIHVSAAQSVSSILTNIICVIYKKHLNDTLKVRLHILCNTFHLNLLLAQNISLRFNSHSIIWLGLFFSL